MLLFAPLAALVPPERPAHQLLAEPAAGPPMPSIVLIVGDDVPLALLGAYGAPSFLTPNLNGLASAPGASAMTAAFTPASVCTPSRVALLTGRYPSQLSKRNDEEQPIDVGFECCEPPMNTWGPSSTLHRVMRSAGYHTAFMGKFHIDSFWHMLPKENERGALLSACAKLDEDALCVNQSCLTAAVEFATGADEAHAIQWRNLAELPNNPFHNPEELADLGKNFVKRSRAMGKRFFLHTNPSLTHSPFDGMDAAMQQKQSSLVSRLAAHLDSFDPYSAAQIAAWPDDVASGGHVMMGNLHDGFQVLAKATAWLDAALQPRPSTVNGAWHSRPSHLHSVPTVEVASVGAHTSRAPPYLRGPF